MSLGLILLLGALILVAEQRLSVVRMMAPGPFLVRVIQTHNLGNLGNCGEVKIYFQIILLG